MSRQISAGLLMFRRRAGQPEIFLAHPGGPYYARKDDGYWTIPKGQIEDGEDELGAATREFQEETGIQPKGPFIPLGTVVLRSGKAVHAWAFAGDCPDGCVPPSNTCEIEWPPRSGKKLTIPEMDKVEFFNPESARRKIARAQEPFIDRLIERIRNEAAGGLDQA